MTRIDHVRATHQHADALAMVLRWEDMRELHAQTGKEAAEVLAAAVDRSELSYATYFDGKLVALWGLKRLRDGAVSPWLMTSETVWQYPVTFARAAREMLPELVRKYGCLENAIDARYARAVKFVQRLGATVEPPAPHGVFGMPFVRFTFN